MEIAKLTTKETATALGLSVRRIIQLANEDRIRHEWTPLGRLFDPTDVERIRREREGRVA